ncbi:MAG: hypothetical protein ACTHM5_13480 [Ginsengibacter sp.]
MRIFSFAFIKNKEGSNASNTWKKVAIPESYAKVTFVKHKYANGMESLMVSQ